MKAIAKELGRNYTTIKREIGDKPRKGRGRYNADLKQRNALDRIAKRGPKTRIRNKNVRQYVEEKLKDRWSPDQISMQLKIDYPKDQTMRISYEAIYLLNNATFCDSIHNVCR